MLCVRHWASGCWLNAWIDVNELMAFTWYAACGHAVWVQTAFPSRRKGEYDSSEWTKAEKRWSHRLD